MKNDNNQIHVCCCAMGCGAGKDGCQQAPQWLKDHGLLEGRALWGRCHQPADSQVRGLDALPQIASTCADIADEIYQVVASGQRFLSLGGDQSCSAGTWSGAAAAVMDVGEQMGLIWLDAHMDAHTPQTTPSGNVHGMPLAALLGHGDERLTQLQSPAVKFKPENVWLIGIRSFEVEEAALLDSLGVNIVFAHQANQQGVAKVIADAVADLSTRTSRFGLAVDMDAFEPSQAPAVGTPEHDGLNLEACCQAFEKCAQSDAFAGLEVVEFNPTLAGAKQTGAAVEKVVQACFLGE